MEVKVINNNDYEIIKGRIDSKLNNAFKKVLSKLNMTQQEFVETKVKEFILEHIDALSSSDKK